MVEKKGRLNNEFYAPLFKHRTINPIHEVSDFIERTGLSDLKGMRCLDAGFGSGRTIIAMMELDADVYGIDISQGNVNRMKGRLKKAKGDIKQGSVFNLPYDDNSFDFVYCNGVIHHTDNPEKALQELARVSKKYVFIGLYGKGLKGSIISVFRALRFPPRCIIPSSMTTLTDLIHVPILKRYTPFETWNMIEDSGLDVISMVRNIRTDYLNIMCVVRGWNR